LLLPPADLIFQSSYGDPFPLRVMQVAEIAAEKLRALSMREATRDVYDLWVIATRQLVDARQVAKLVPHKLQTVHLVLSPETLTGHLAAVEPVWVNELRLLMPDVPDFSQVASDLRPWLDAILDIVVTNASDQETTQ
jgi:predicted nucleotidyltransferase component of viral defense system